MISPPWPRPRIGALAPSRLHLASLAYRAEGGRDLRLDFLRGFSVLAMVVDHLAGPSPLRLFTGGNRFYTSAAEAFVVISGLIVGLVYRRIAERDGLGVALRRMVDRAWQLYLLALGLTLVMLPVSEGLGLPWAQGINLGNPLALVLSVVTAHQTYYLVDVPLLYALLLLAAPPAFVLISEGRTWVVLLASWGLWAGFQVFPEQTDYPWPIAGNYLFSFPAWQVLFVTAMAIGYHWRRVQAVIRPSWHRPLLLASGLGVVLLLLLYAFTDTILDEVISGARGGESPAVLFVDLMLGKGYVRPGRIVASAIVFPFVFLLTSELWGLLRRALGWLLLPLGQHALYAYTLHVGLALALGIAAVTAGVDAAASPWASAAVQALSLLLIWLAVRYLPPFPTPQARRLAMFAPAALAVALLVLLPFDPSPDLPGLAPEPTPAPSGQARLARAFGSPVPRGQVPPPPPGAGQRLPGLLATPRPPATPTPVPALSTPEPLPPPAEPTEPPPWPEGEAPASPYIGPLNGSFRELEFTTEALGGAVQYFIYLPPGYRDDDRRYPVLYLLHGGSGDKEEWVAYGAIDAVDRLITAREIRPLIVVLPWGDWGYWMNQIDGLAWGDYVSRDLVDHIDRTFRTLPDPGHRAIGGLSMGGAGALQLAFNHPEVFGGAGAHSPSLREEGNLPFMGTGEEYARRDPIHLAGAAPGIEQVRIWIDIGEDDPWRERAELLHRALEERGIAHAWHLLPGGHEGEYWQRNLVDYLRFYDQALNGGT